MMPELKTTLTAYCYDQACRGWGQCGLCHGIGLELSVPGGGGGRRDWDGYTV